MSSMDKVAKELYSAISKKDERTPKPYDTEATVVREEGDTIWVKIPGGIDETPVRKTINAKPGDNVQVRVADGRAWVMGNSTNPPTDDSTANYAVNIANGAQKDVLVLNTVVAENIEATNARFGYVEADTAKIHDLTADQLTASVGYIEDLTADHITASDISADHATIDTLDANYAHITNGVIDNAKIGYADVNDLNAHYAHITSGVIDNAKIGYADVKDLNAHYANINLANVNNAWIESGVIKNGAIADAQIIGVSANKLTAGTIDASNITVTNLNASNITTGSITVDGITIDVENNEASIDGEYIEDGTITLSGLAQDVTDKIDGAIETFTGAVVPTLNNYPASSWTTTKDKDSHIGDVYYVLNADNTSDGYCYRFAKDGNTYKWVLIKDSDVTAALSRLTTAEGKISGLESFESTTSSWITNTDEELSSIKTNHTTLVGVVDKTLVETVQLWFTKANTTAPNKPTARVTTNDASKPNMWNIAVPTYNSSYPNYYYCYQWKYADGTYGWSSVTRDIAMGESQSTARTAASNASAAVSTANTASTNASNAVSTANTASTNASNAVSTANSAASTASAAQTTANSAASDASAAVSTANTASTNASNAVGTANTAKATADKNVKKAVQLWYTKANTTAPGKPTAHVTSTSTDGNAWRTVVPTYNASYPYYYYCYEYEAADGTYTWSDVVYDRATSEAEERARTAVTNAATAQTAAETADGKAVAAQTAATTADGKAVAAQNTANANIKSTVQLWFTKANTTAPSKPSAHVTNNNPTGSNSYNKWNIAVPEYNSTYPNYFYCYEYQKGDNTYAWSDVVFDKATTENQANARSALSQVATKVETSTFNTLSQTVDSNTANITSLTTITENNGLTASTNITNTVNTVNQTATGNSSKISQLTTTLGTNADGTTKTGDIVHRTSAVEQDLSGFKTTVSETYQTKDDMSGYSTTQQMNSAINQKADEISTSVANTYHKTSDFNTYKTANDTAVADAKKAGTDAQSDLDNYKNTVEETYASKTSLTQTENSIKQEVSTTYTTQETFNSYKTTNNAAVQNAQDTADTALSKFDPIVSKTYTGLIGTANTAADASFYFAKVHPTNYNAQYTVKMHLDISVAGQTNYKQVVDITIIGQRSTYRMYDSLTARDDYLSLYYVNLYRATSAGIETNHKGHALGFGLRNSTNPLNATYARTIKVDILALENCEIQMLDTAVKYADMDGTGSTNYSALSEFNVSSSGQNATNNANSNYTQHGSVIAGHAGIKRYTLLMRDTPNTWVSFVNQVNSTATNKTVITTGLMLGEILYHATAGEYAETKASGTVYSMYPLDFRYSSNCGTTLVAYKPLYLVGTINNNDGLFYLDTTQWWTQTLPSTEDGKTYVFVGTTYSNYQTYLEEKNPAYQFYDGKVRELESVEMLKQNKATFDVLDDKITSKVSAVETTSKSYTDGKISQEVTDRNSAITQKANEITQTVSETYVHGSDSKSGDIVTWQNMLIKDVVANIEPIQDLHGYDKPWSGGNGANKWDEEWEVGTISNSTGQNQSYSGEIRSKNYIPVIPNATYYNKKGSGGNSQFYKYDANKNYLGYFSKANNSEITIPSDCYYIRFRCGDAYGTTYNHDIAINYPSTVTTYSPYSNICPISGRTEVVTSRCGENVWDEEWELGDISASDGQNIKTSTVIRTKNYIAVKPETQYFAYIGGQTGLTVRTRFYDAEKNYIGTTQYGGGAIAYNTVFKTPTNCYYMRFTPQSAYGTTYNHDISINYPSTDHDYHAYNGTSYTTALGRTVYGGSLDVVSGLLTVDRAMVDLGGLSWSYWNELFFADVEGKAYLNTNADVLSDSYETYPTNFSDASTASRALSDGQIAGFIRGSGSATKSYIYVKDSRYTNANIFKTAVNGAQLVYELATPQTYQLTPQEVSALVGWNALWTNCGSVRVDLTGVKDFTDDVSELKITADEISTRVGKTEAHLISMYATSSTAEGTAAKVATITPAIPSGTNWELSTGTTITVKFTNANTTASPTLNVNSKGAKPIKTYANGNLSEAEYKWKAGSTFTFTYNGTNWLMQDSTASVRMSSVETSITQTADSIISLASNQSTYTKPDGTTGTNAMASAIIQNAGNIALKANVADVYSKTESDERFGDHLYVDTTYSGSNIVFTARVILDGVDVTSQYLDGDFEWFYRTPTGDVPLNMNGKSISIPQASQEYGRTVVCVWTRRQYANLLINNGNKLRISNGNYLLGRSEY